MDDTCAGPPGVEAFRWLAVARVDNTKIFYKDCAGFPRNSGLGALALGDTWQLDCLFDATADRSGDLISGRDYTFGFPVPISVIGGSESSAIPNVLLYDDNPLLEQQLPVSWGGGTYLVSRLQHGAGATDDSELIRIINVSSNNAMAYNLRLAED